MEGDGTRRKEGRRQGAIGAGGLIGRVIGLSLKAGVGFKGIGRGGRGREMKRGKGRE